MKHRSKRTRFLAATGELALIVAGGESGAGPVEQIVRDRHRFEVSWIDADDTTGTETIAIDLRDAPGQASSDPSPKGTDSPNDPMTS